MPAMRFRRKLETATIHRDKSIVLIVKAVPWQSRVRVRNDHALERGVVEILPAGLRCCGAAEPPIPVHRQDEPSTCLAHGRRTRSLSECALRKHPGDHSAGFLDEVPSLHGRMSASMV